MNHPPKPRIRQSFERAAASYDAAAEVQRAICGRLAELLPATMQAPKRLLDAGCGTGYALSLLATRWPQAERLALDFAPAMLARVPAAESQAAARRIAGDLERLPLADASLDLYWTSLAVQWCELPRVLAEARRTLRADGTLALATLGPATFHELRTIFAGVDRHEHTLSFLEAGQIADAARQAGFLTVNLENRQKTLHYPDLRSLLKAVKATGANQVGSGRRTALLGREAFRRAEVAAETLRTPAGLPLTYDVIYLIAQP